MATASCSCSSSSASHSSRCDVFLCFRGDDTRHGFTSHLMSALCDRQIQTFIDDKLEKTESIGELQSILQRTALSVVVFSVKFADSVWCLDEVATIARKMKESGHRVLPVFYKVDPSDVTDDARSYAATIDREHKSRSSYVEDKKRWMDALNVVADSAGHTSQTFKNESELIKVIVEDVLKKLIGLSPVIKNDNLVAMSSRIFEVERLLAMDKVKETRVVGLWGMGGVGKTTLARACYERITWSDKGIKCLFISNVNEKYGKHLDVEEVVCKYYSKLLNEDNIDREDLNITYRRGRLSRLRVFIVLDNVETSQQLEQLILGGISDLSTVFATGSRILVTTKNREVLRNATKEIYKVECLNAKESTQLFSLHAFKHDFPQNWTDKCRLATSYCKGHPLALKILGGALCSRDMHYWESFLSGLKQTGDTNIHNVFRRSYDMLGEIEQIIFLDVACLFDSIPKSQLIEYMSTMHPASLVKVEILIDRSLLACVSNEKIEVHDLLKEMAWNIVNGEPKLGKRSRLADPDDIRKLLRARDVHNFFITSEVKNWNTSFLGFFKAIGMVVLPKMKRRRIADMHWKGKCPLEEHRMTEGIRLDLSKAKEMYLEADAFEGMNSLSFLKFHGYVDKTKVHLPYGGLSSLPDGLRWLEWYRYPSKSLPSNFYPQHLTHLIIQFSPIQRCWKGHDQPQLVNLLVLILSYCSNLIAIPDISSSSKLQELILDGCGSLVEVPSHVQYLTKLITLNLHGCRNLKRLPSRLDSKLLKHVTMSCLNVRHCPEIISKELEQLDLFETSLVELPSAIYNVKQNGALCLYGENITKFPAVTANLNTFSLVGTSIRDIGFYDRQTSSESIMPKFNGLRLYENLQLKSLPSSIWNMVSYQLHIHGSPLIEKLPDISEPVTSLTHIHISECGSLKTLPSSISNIRSLKVLHLSNKGIKSLPSSIQELRELSSINLSDCTSLESIPTGIHKLSKLVELAMPGCESIQALPKLPQNLKSLEVSGCKFLQALPSNTSELLHLKELRFNECPQLVYFLVHPILYRSLKCQLVCSRSELPEWLTDKGMNLKKEDEGYCNVKVELPPPNNTGQPMIVKGFAFGVVFSSCFWLDMRCDCKVGNTIIASWHCSERGKSSKETLWLQYEKMAVGSKEDEAWYVKYAGVTVSFNFHFHNLCSIIKLVKPKIKRCGVCLLY